MKLVFFGTPQFAVPSLERLLAEPGFEVLAVVTQPDKRRGRGKELSPSPVKAIAQTHNLPVWQPRRVKRDAETLDALRSYEADAFVVVAYGQILSQEILDMPRLGCINGHGSLLPDYRGAAPIQWSIVHGKTETGITTMLMDAGMDTGPMLIKGQVPIGLFDTFFDVAEKLAAQSGDLLVQTLHGLEAGTLIAEPQDAEQATYAPLIQKADYWVDWGKGAIALHNQIRGFFPNCVATFRDSSIKLLKTAPLGVVDDQLPPDLQALASEWQPFLQAEIEVGAIATILKGWGPVVKTGEGLLLLQEIQLPGKKAQSGADFVNGSRLEVGERFGTPQLKQA
ncbi:MULTISPECIES: methionyl-tRNA formyltransferase [unclassified Leptolyngbya]|uniref:methionyl-tRNA formyltransferase n=1 Tax=unclassified Leptolyngbya TaxID=2650499 RepID=UPI001688B76D|nr:MULTISPECIES: methionyl-tRNA formyltransferase [unclassified Leptolyngbya]MBD1913568.1 methionyl-tRNA formyltransferase [Leptolyngbya sp. FACHB-8]MBD2155861.1 methionyl-tRNA formyltransferase [Leptolyngbya sp. FACHB-16]